MRCSEKGVDVGRDMFVRAREFRAAEESVLMRFGFGGKAGGGFAEGAGGVCNESEAGREMVRCGEFETFEAFVICEDGARDSALAEDRAIDDLFVDRDGSVFVGDANECLDFVIRRRSSGWRVLGSER